MDDDELRRKLIMMARLFTFAGKVTDVYDGDTCTIENIDLGLKIDYREYRLRWLGFDAAELSEDGGHSIRVGVEAIILNRWVLIATRIDPRAESKVDSFGRLLVEVFTPVFDGGPWVNLNQWLVEVGVVEEKWYGMEPSWTRVEDVMI